jgi:hypothetical protein
VTAPTSPGDAVGAQEERIASLLRLHGLGFRETSKFVRSAWYCTAPGCSWVVTIVADGCDQDGVTRHDQHIAHQAKILAARLAPVEAEVERLRAQIAAVEALRDRWQHTPDHYCCLPCRLRAALSSPAPDTDETPGTDGGA